MSILRIQAGTWTSSVASAPHEFKVACIFNPSQNACIAQQMFVGSLDGSSLGKICPANPVSEVIETRADGLPVWQLFTQIGEPRLHLNPSVDLL